MTQWDRTADEFHRQMALCVLNGPRGGRCVWATLASSAGDRIRNPELATVKRATNRATEGSNCVNIVIERKEKYLGYLHTIPAYWDTYFKPANVG